MKDRMELLLTYGWARLDPEEGQALIEYALIISLVALLAIGGLTLAGGKIDQMFSAIGNSLNLP